MDTLVNQLLEYGIVGLLIIGLIVLTPLLPKYLDAINYVKRTKERAIIDAINDDSLSESSQKLLNQKRETDLYFRNLNIRADYYLIQSINKLIEHSQGAITVRTVKLAISHLSNNKDGLIVKIDKHDILIKRIFGIFFWLFVFLTIVMVFFIVFIIRNILLNPTTDYIVLLIMYFIYFLAASIGMVAFLKGRMEVVSAEKVIDYLSNHTDIEATVEDAR
ncbi:hypothetical protein [Psychrobacter fulvigenes]|uniref:hypothetical protein n=1 Tax=Psychrobacter fulvigenes TaxID=533323 RepID=UPI00191B0C85|nr:hypothetical protein [Psychrobacter fulvigenes]